MINIFRINDLIDLPVIDSMSARKLCSIKDVIIDIREYRVHALVCREKVLGRSLEAMPFKNVESISQNGIWVKGSFSHMCSRSLLTKQKRLKSYQHVLGKLVRSHEGESLGVIRDILFDTDTGIIKAYELSEGYIDDFLRGRHIVEMKSGHSLLGYYH